MQQGIRENTIFFSGILGVMLFTIASLMGNYSIDNYSPVTQYISESMAIDTPYGQVLRYYGYIPSGILIIIFSILSANYFSGSIIIKTGFAGIGIFYGLATIMVGIFPCDSGCNKEMIDPSVSQIIHNLMGLLTYIFVPASIFTIGYGLRKLKQFIPLSNYAFACGFMSIIFIGILFSNPLSSFAGLYQRIVEGLFIVFIVACAFSIKKSITQSSESN